MKFSYVQLHSVSFNNQLRVVQLSLDMKKNTKHSNEQVIFWESDLNERYTKKRQNYTVFRGFSLSSCKAVKFCAGWNKNCSSDPYEICCGYMGGICAMRDGMSLRPHCIILQIFQSIQLNQTLTNVCSVWLKYIKGEKAKNCPK